jgi:hypothetical protein
MTAVLADRFVAQLTPAAVAVLVILCRNAPEPTYEALQAEVQAQLGISRERLGAVLTSLAAARKRLPLDVDYPIQRDKDLRRYRIEPVARRAFLGCGRTRSRRWAGHGTRPGRCVGQDIAAVTLARDLHNLRLGVPAWLVCQGERVKSVREVNLDQVPAAPFSLPAPHLTGAAVAPPLGPASLGTGRQSGCAPSLSRVEAAASGADMLARIAV